MTTLETMKSALNNQIATIVLSVTALLSTAPAVHAQTVAGEEIVIETNLTAKERMIHRRAVEVATWGLPLANFHAMRNGFQEGLGAQPNDIIYGSQIQDWRMQITTPNNTTPYIMSFWNLRNGPMVIEIPRSQANVGLYGAMLDSWHRPLEDMGAKGRDAGAGAKYIVLPPNYDGPLPSGPGRVVVKSTTYENYFLLRPLIANASKENLKRAADFAKQVKVYPLSQMAKPKANNYLDYYGKDLNLVTAFDHTMFSKINDIVQQEPVEEKDLAFRDLLATVGIVKGKPYAPDARMKHLLDSAAKETHSYFIDASINSEFNNAFFKDWKSLATSASIPTQFKYDFPSYVDVDNRAVMFFLIFGPVKNYDTFSPNSFYLMSANDKQGQVLNGSNNYQLTVPADAPAKQFWSILAYEFEDATWFDNVPKEGVASNDKDMQENEDGSVTLYFGPQAPKGKEGNWIPTVENQDYFLVFRLYGVKKEFFKRQWVLEGLEKK